MSAMASYAGRPNDLAELCYSVAEDSPFPTAAVDGSNHIVRYANPAFCRLAGRRNDEIIGVAFCNLIPAGKECLALMNRVYNHGSTEFHTGQEGTSDHPLFWSYSMWPVLGHDRIALGICLQIAESTSVHQNTVAVNQALLVGSLRQHELTERAERLNVQLQAEILVSRLAQEALIRSEKLASVGRMASVMAHEINNPLDAVMNAIYLVQGVPGLPDPAPQYLEIAEEELKRISHITRQTLGFYRESILSSTFPVSGLISSVVGLLRAKIKVKRASIIEHCDETLQMNGIFGELRQVLANLLLNSLDAIDDHGTIKIRASMVPASLGNRPCIRITIGDDGRGIGPATLPQIFEPFFTTKGAVGNGLGLWVSRQIIEKHGGSIRARSSVSGRYKGTVFSIVLPVTFAGLTVNSL